MQTEKQLKGKGKLLSLVLRHRPELIGIELDDQGWVPVVILLEKLEAFGKPLSLSALEQVVKNNNKKRFSFNADKTMIRANQGHSIKIDLGYDPIEPPEFLYHGTAKKNVESILKQGIQKRKRHHVHLSGDEETAKAVGGRHGVPVILRIKSKEMYKAGILFYRSKNEIWLTEYIYPKYILLPE